MDRAAKLRAFFARYVTEHAGVTDPRIEAAFAKIPRAPFFGPAPWFIPVAPFAGDHRKRSYLPTPDDDPAFLYQDGLIALDHERGIHNGVPSLHALCLDRLKVQPGDEILHIGAGTGYYAALLAELTADAGRVHAFEIDPSLAARAERNLAPWGWIDVQNRSGTSANLPMADVIYVNAGVTAPCAAWLDALKPGGKLLFPLQPKNGFGGFLLVRRPSGGDIWPAKFICPAHFIPCEDIPQPDAASAVLKQAFADESWKKVTQLHRNDSPGASCWAKGEGWWLSTEQ